MIEVLTFYHREKTENDQEINFYFDNMKEALDALFKIKELTMFNKTFHSPSISTFAPTSIEEVEKKKKKYKNDK